MSNNSRKKAAIRVKDNFGKFEKNATIRISKDLTELSDNLGLNIKPIIRDELVKTLRSNIYASYGPATLKGKEIDKYNQEHKHQKKQLYHHTGTLVGAVYGSIEGNKVQALIRDDKYADGTSAKDVYQILKQGTPIAPSGDHHSYYTVKDNGKEGYYEYISQPPHPFEQQTIADMKVYLQKMSDNASKSAKEFLDELGLYGEGYFKRYRQKRK